ncbi:ABC drug exporter AbcA [Xylariomycetidae sp. FL0641]|nr:ABC drug exporter AbcA [Xylariomycetidae sp. FL0641]
MDLARCNQLLQPAGESGNKTQSQVGVAFRQLQCDGTAPAQRTLRESVFSIRRLHQYLLEFLHVRPMDRFRILHNLDGLAHPGEMVLVLGRPGSGCSTFLKALSGNTHGFDISDCSVINYQGFPPKQSFQGGRVYLAEHDVHFPELTIGQTLDFASSIRTHASGTETGRNYSRLFGLANAFDTKVGCDTIRGISGGEKRRLSIAEAFISGAWYQFWDNSTRGLDSSTARRVIEILRQSTDSKKTTVFMSLYQASERMYQHFDKVTLLYEGRQIYFGPARLAADYFIMLGFIRPDRVTTADFLTSLTNPAERQIRPSMKHKVPRTPEEFASVWDRSSEAKQLRLEIQDFGSLGQDRPHEKGSQTVQGRMSGTSTTWVLPVHLQVMFCIRRAFQRLRNNLGPSLSAIIANSILGLIVGSAFYNLNGTTDSLQPRATFIFFVLLLNAFAPAFEVSLMWAQRPIVEKHHRYMFYQPFAERAASIICDLPVKVAISFGVHLPAYFLAGLRAGASRFMIYWLFMFANLLTMSMLFRFIGSVSRRLDQTLIPVSVIVLLSVIYTGFVVPPSFMRPWLAWFWRVNPIAYTYESLMLNEMDGVTFPCSESVPSGPSYALVSSSDKRCAAVGSMSSDEGVQGEVYLAEKYGYIPSHLWRNFGIILGMMVSFCILHLLAAQFVPMGRSRGEILRYRTRHIRLKDASNDLECGRVEGVSAQGGGTNERLSSMKGDHSAADTLGPGTSLAKATVFRWKSLSYGIESGRNPRRILENIDGWVMPGTLTALMGPTGAGKTTLLDVLSGRTTTGVVTGDILVSNQSYLGSSFQRRVGYAQQQDIHLPASTVREALEFSARLRQPRSTSWEEIREDVETTLKMLEMQHYADAIIGLPGEGLNIEQRKRLTIAVELVAKPELLLFLDEPTSGLDSQTAWSVCMLLRKLANNGQTILCTIHQPSSQIFSMFDRLLLLDQRGRTVFFGDIGQNASNMITYFESNGAPKCGPKQNPAEWMLDFTVYSPKGDGSSAPCSQDWAQKWEKSVLRDAMLQQMAQLGSGEPPPAGTGDTEALQEYAAPHHKQLYYVSKRLLQDQWRDRIYMSTKLTLSVGLAFVNGVSFLSTSLDMQGLISILFSLFLLMQMFTGVGQLVANRIADNRDLFEARERNSKMYSWTVFLTSNLLIEILWQILISVPMFLVWYFPSGLQHNGDITFNAAERGGLTFILMCLFNLWSSTLCQAFAASMPQPGMALQISTLFYWLSLTFCGVLVSPSSLPGFWRFMYHVSPLTYFVQGIAVAGVANTDITCTSIETVQVQVPQNWPTKSCSQYLADYLADAGGYLMDPTAENYCDYCPVADTNSVLRGLGIQTRHPWHNAGFLSIYVGFNTAAIFIIYKITRVRKGRH